METLLVVITILASLALLALVGWHYYRKNNPKKYGGQSRDNRSSAAVSAAGSFARRNSGRLIAPATLESANGTAALDALVIGYFGILGVKALGYSGEIYGSAKEEEWLQVDSDKKRSYFPNPVLEAAADVRIIRDALFAAKLKKVPVEVVAVFTDNHAQLALPRGTGHYNMKEFKALLAKDKYEVDSGLDLDKTEAAIRAVLKQKK